jgi:PPOX class probable F420-dependent enzyme
VSRVWVEGIRSLLEAPAPAVLTTYRQDGSAHTVPVWFRWTDEALEVVIAKGDVKLRHLARDPRCVLVIFETVRPFRGVEVRGRPSWSRGMSPRRERPSRGVISAWRMVNVSRRRTTIQARVLLRLVPDSPRVWDLSSILPA